VLGLWVDDMVVPLCGGEVYEEVGKTERSGQTSMLEGEFEEEYVEE
jgi:hypothetical protein